MTRGSQKQMSNVIKYITCNIDDDRLRFFYLKNFFMAQDEKEKVLELLRYGLSHQWEIVAFNIN